MKTKFEATINLTVDDVKEILLHHFNLPANSQITFNLRETGDDRFGSTWKEFAGADIVSEVPNPKFDKKTNQDGPKDGPNYR